MRLLALTCLLIGLALAPAAGQEVLTITEVIRGAGTLEAVAPGLLSIRDSRGRVRQYKIQESADGYVPIAGTRGRLRSPAQVAVTGEISLDALQPGVVLRCRVRMSPRGAIAEEIDRITVVDEGAKRGVVFDTPPESPRDAADATLTAVLVKVSRNRLTVEVPESDQLRRSRLTLRLTDDWRVLVDSTDHRRAQPGDVVESFEANQLSTGDLILSKLKVRLSPAAKRSAEGGNKLAQQHRDLSDEPRQPRDVRSQHFLLHTDISDRSAAVLLDKLETMLDLISRYYGRTTPRPIECYVVRDLKQWGSYLLDRAGVMKIAEGAGVTLSRSLGDQAWSVVYSCDKHGTVQHEAVHAFCFQAFGSTGPTWYSEGMAEMGQYWKQGERAVSVSPSTIDYLKSAQPKGLLEIVRPGQITGDSWEAYSWRWALCHLLANNPNYSGRFKALGVGMMQKRGPSFQSVYGDVAPQIAFEYDEFCRHVDNGYRADLAAWDWQTKSRPLSGKRPIRSTILAARGWQPAGVEVERDQRYEVAASGEWKTHAAAKSNTAAGAEHGGGRLLGVVLRDFKLSEPFDLGERAEFTAPTDGDLYLRCNDAWNQLADNEGELTVHVRRAESP